MLTIRAVVVFASLLGASFLSAQDEAGVTALLGKLQSQNIETRHQAIRELQTSLDPRIPDACLPVLNMEGDSIRRLAARAIGSRWHQIPKDRVPVFIAALKEQLKSEHDGLKNMARRGIALPQCPSWSSRGRITTITRPRCVGIPPTTNWSWWASSAREWGLTANRPPPS